MCWKLREQLLELLNHVLLEETSIARVFARSSRGAEKQGAHKG